MSSYGIKQRGSIAMKIGSAVNNLEASKTENNGSESEKLFINSPTTGEKIFLQEVLIPSESVWDCVYKSKYNTRSRKLMTPATVMEILPTIRSGKRNMIPAIAVKDSEGKYEIISGMKRSYAVSLSPGTQLVVHYANEMSEQDKEKLAFAADLTEKPSFLDTALTLKELKEELGDKFNVRAAAAIHGISKSAVAEFVKFADLPTELFSLFPGAAYVSWKFLRDVIKSEKTNDEIIKLISGISPIDTDVDKVLAEGALRTLKAECKVLERHILDVLNGSQKAQQNVEFSENHPFHGQKLIAGVVVKPGPKGAVSITLSNDFIDSPRLAELLKAISE
jgi:ParB/RepB/Spo0J family partition protein